VRRTAAVFVLAALCAVVVAVWAMRPVVDELGRDCGGGVFGTTQPNVGDDSYLDVCNGDREQRAQAVGTAAIPVGLVLLVSGGWLSFLVWERRQAPT
jgi:hypothetical protein